ncbi:tetratricopeptide repeat protein [Rhizobium sp. NRK18]|uniref:tetratricopeptide repeat protein n=1 Tax=Rhizobium sp. NRK18 TaxID=2964667 RepID=UPI0021C44E12|nr:tetratricopeptide repeat protein [Rhizobium sp. NRK18]MCQ2002659.1 tetratricopeptide repeat protein [Rhizobium sp. NRK18]
MAVQGALQDCVKLIGAGKAADAVANLQALAEDHPDDADVHHYLGLALHLSGRSAEGIAVLKKAAELEPDNAAIHQNMVLPFLATGDVQQAIAAGERSVALAPRSLGARVNFILALTRGGDWQKAAVACEEALSAFADNPTLLTQMGHILLQLDRREEAEEHLRRALAIRPEEHEASYNLGVLLQRQGNDGEAVEYYRRTLDSDPRHQGAIINRAVCLRNLGRVTDALTALESAPLKPEDFPALAYNIAWTKLLLGRWSEAWADYEKRVGVLPQPARATVSDAPLWRGEDLTGKTVVVLHEQGLGDTIQFVRLLPLIGEKAEKVIFVCQPQLHALLKTFPAFRDNSERFELVADGEAPLPTHDYHKLLMSLPGLLGLQPDQPNGGFPYLSAEPERKDKWAAFPDRPEGTARPLRIGLSWQGNPNAATERGRSVPLEVFATLGALGDGVEFISLQKGPGADQPAPDGLNLLKPGPDFDAGSDAFLDTAGLIASLDLVITSDTAVAHLAGAMGRPVWLLLMAAPDWRWGLSGELTAWYPTMRLFRQPEQGDWAGVMARVATELKGLVDAPQPIDPDPGTIALEQAIAVNRRGDFTGAAKLYRHMMARRGRSAQLLNLTAMAELEAGGRAREAALACLPLALHSLALAPAVTDFWSNLSIALDSAGFHRDSERALIVALKVDPAHIPSHLSLVRREIAAGHPDGALSRAKALLSHHPDNLAVLSAYANACTAIDRPEEAERALAKACRLAPADSKLLVQWGAALLALGRSDEAARAWERAIIADPANSDAWNNLGVQERSHGEPDIAVWFQRQAVAARPGNAEAWSNLGVSEMDAGREEEAIACFRKAIELRPAYADPKMALGMALMNNGDLAAGLPLYEERLNVGALGLGATRPKLDEWKGEDPAGKSFLLLAEQGFGDAFQFVRYAAVLKERGAAKVFVGCRGKIAALMAGAKGVDGVVREGDRFPATDYYAFMMSLPMLCGTRVESIPSYPSYLTANDERQTRWAEWLNRKPGFRVGIVWQGNPDPKVDRGRSFPLSTLEPLAAIPGVRLIALQKGPGEEQIAALSGRFAIDQPPEDFDSGPDAFADTAAMMMNLDLIVTSDTATAHLAGALGKPVWILLKAKAEWRFLRGRSDSPWYPSARLFRQVAGETPGSPFAGAVGRLARELEKLVRGDRSVLFRTHVEPEAPPAPTSEREQFAAAIRAHVAGKTEVARKGYAGLLSKPKTEPEALHMLGAMALETQNFARAHLFFLKAQEKGLKTREFRTNFAIALRNLGKVAEAEAMLRGCLAEKETAEAQMTLGNLLRDDGRFSEAIAAYERAIILRPEISKSHRGLANALKDVGRTDEAIDAFNKALALAPGDTETLIDRAHAYLQKGNLPAGFKDYEHRFFGLEMKDRKLAIPRWRGEPIGDKVLFVHGEQGFGDQIQFARFVVQAATMAGHVVLELRDPLIPLFRALPGTENVIITRQGIDPVPIADFEIPMLSLPLVFGTTLETLPRPVPFAVDQAAVETWRATFGGKGKFRVGLVWQGNPNARADNGRSPPLKSLAPLFDLPDMHFVALQFRDGLDQLRDVPFADRIEVPGEALGDFASTAAAMQALDLVISSCTSSLHLAATQGLPTFGLLKYNSDWRWMRDRSDSPWYPKLRLIRQPKMGDWDSVAEKAATALKSFAEWRR